MNPPDGYEDRGGMLVRKDIDAQGRPIIPPIIRNLALGYAARTRFATLIIMRPGGCLSPISFTVHMTTGAGTPAQIGDSHTGGFVVGIAYPVL